MGSAFTFFAETWSSFLLKDTIDRITIMATLVLPILIPLFGYVLGIRTWQTRKRLLEQEILRLEKTRKKAEKDRDVAQDELDNWKPGAWLKKAERERNEGNEEKALQLLMDGMGIFRQPLSAVCGELANSYAGMITPDDQAYLAASVRYSRLGLLLDPNNRELTTLLDELNLLWSNEGSPHWTDELPEQILPTDPEAATLLIGSLGAVREKAFVLGHYRLCVNLDRRRCTIAKRADLDAAPIGLTARYYYSQSLCFAGDAAKALTKVQDLLPIYERVHQGKEHPSVLSTRYLEAQLLKDTGDAAKALTKVQDLLPIYERVHQGKEHPSVLSTRYLEAQLLKDTGDAAKALTKVQDLLPIYERVHQGKEHPSVLATRYLEAELLKDTGDAAKALTKVQDLLSIEERVHQGKEHPSVLSTRYLEAQLLKDTGDAAKALTKVQDLLPIYERVHQGKEHPSVLSTRYLEAQLLKDTGDAAKALTKVQDLLPIYERVQGKEHPDALRTRWLRVVILATIGRIDEALKELRGILPLQIAARSAKHKHVKETIDWINRLEGREPGEDL